MIRDSSTVLSVSCEAHGLTTWCSLDCTWTCLFTAALARPPPGPFWDDLPPPPTLLLPDTLPPHPVNSGFLSENRSRSNACAWVPLPRIRESWDAPERSLMCRLILFMVLFYC